MPPSALESLRPALPSLDSIDTGLHTPADTLRESTELAQLTGAPDFDFLLEAADGRIICTDIFAAIDKLLEARLISQADYDNSRSTYLAILDPQSNPAIPPKNPDTFFGMTRVFTEPFSAKPHPSKNKPPVLLLQDLIIITSRETDLMLGINGVNTSIIQLILAEASSPELLPFRDVLIKKLIKQQYFGARTDPAKSEEGSKTKRSAFITNLQHACEDLTDEQLEIMKSLVGQAIDLSFADKVFPDPSAETMASSGVLPFLHPAEELPPLTTDITDQTLTIVIRILDILAGGNALTKTHTNLRDLLHLLQQETNENGASIRGLEDHMSGLGEGIKLYLETLVGDVAKASPKLRERLQDHTLPEPNSLTGIADRVETTHHQLAVILDLLILKLGALKQPMPLQESIGKQVETLAATFDDHIQAIKEDISFLKKANKRKRVATLRKANSWKRVATLIASGAGLIGATALSTWLLVREATETEIAPPPQVTAENTPVSIPQITPTTAPTAAPPAETAVVSQPPAPTSNIPPAPITAPTPKTISVSPHLNNTSLTFKEDGTHKSHPLALNLPQNSKVTLVPAKSGFKAYLKVVISKQKGLIWLDETIPEDINTWKPATANFRNEESLSVWKTHDITIRDNTITVHKKDN